MPLQPPANLTDYPCHKLSKIRPLVLTVCKTHYGGLFRIEASVRSEGRRRAIPLPPTRDTPASSTPCALRGSSCPRLSCPQYHPQHTYRPETYTASHRHAQLVQTQVSVRVPCVCVGIAKSHARHIYVYICMYTHTHTHIHICIYIHTHTHTHTHTREQTRHSTNPLVAGKPHDNILLHGTNSQKSVP
jgi:hypothetical protein